MPHLGLGLDLGGRRAIGSRPLAPSAVTSQFIVDTILGKVDFTDNSSGTAQHEIYSNTNAAGRVLLTTLGVGITTFNDTTCKQNASVVYEIRAKRGSSYSDFMAATALVTPLCWKTNQTTLTPFIINVLNISAGKTVTVNYSDGTSQAYTGNNSTITKNFSTTGQYNVWLTGDTNSITSFQHVAQAKSYGVITNWKFPSLTFFSIYSSGFTGVVTDWDFLGLLTNFSVAGNLGISGEATNWNLSSSLIGFSVSSTGITGSLPQIVAHETNALSYQAQTSYFSDSGVTVFRKAMTIFNISNQKVPFSTAKIDKVLKALADWYQNNAPTANCMFTMDGTNNGIPTGGASNVDLVRLAGYYTAAGKTATIVISS
jgi:hypothetical protein